MFSINIYIIVKISGGKNKNNIVKYTFYKFCKYFYDRQG